MRPLVAALALVALLGCRRETPSAPSAPKAKSASTSAACTDEARKAPHCGGIAALRCPAGLSCVDDPCDDCDPNHGGADCGGICVAK